MAKKKKNSPETSENAAVIDFNKSTFSGGAFGLWGTNFVCGLITLFTLGIGYAWASCKKRRWVSKHTKIDGRQLVFEGRGGGLFVHYIKCSLLTFITLGIYSFWIPARLERWYVERTHLEPLPVPPLPPAGMGMGGRPGLPQGGAPYAPNAYGQRPQQPYGAPQQRQPQPQQPYGAPQQRPPQQPPRY